MSRSVSDIQPLFSDQLLAANSEESSRNVETETMSMQFPNRNAVCVGGVRGLWKTGAVFCQGVGGSQRGGPTTAPHPRREIRISQ